MKIAVEKRYCGQKHVSKFHQHLSFTCNVSHPNAIINESKDLNGPSTFHGKKYFGSLLFSLSVRSLDIYHYQKSYKSKNYRSWQINTAGLKDHRFMKENSSFIPRPFFPVPLSL